jgi:hypothetical protein
MLGKWQSFILGHMKAILNKKVYFVLLILVIASLPWHEHLNGVCTLLLMLWTFLYNLYYRPVWHEWRERPWMLLHWAWYALFAIGLLWTADYSEGIFNLEVHMLLVLVPWMWATALPLHKREFHGLMWVFVVSVLLTLPYMLWGIIPFYLKYREINMWLITQTTPFHHGFLGMYWVSSLWMVAYLLSRKRAAALFFIFYYLLVMSVLLLINAKAALIAFAALSFLAPCFWLSSFKQYRKHLALSVAVGFAVLLCLFLVGIKVWQGTNYHYQVDSSVNLRSAFDLTGFLQYSFYHRLGQWHCGVEVWTQDWQTFLFGVGTGDATQALNACYTANDWDWLQGYSTHNEFLEEAVRHGLIGLLLLLAVFLYPVIRSIRRGNYWYVLQSVAFFAALMVDCYLSNQKGIVWYMWIGSLWYWLPQYRSSLPDSESEV